MTNCAEILTIIITISHFLPFPFRSATDHTNDSLLYRLVTSFRNRSIANPHLLFNFPNQALPFHHFVFENHVKVFMLIAWSTSHQIRLLIKMGRCECCGTEGNGTGICLSCFYQLETGAQQQVVEDTEKSNKSSNWWQKWKSKVVWQSIPWSLMDWNVPSVT